MRILLVKLSSLGDIIHVLPVLSALKCIFPNSKIDWAVDEGFYGFLKGHPYINKLVPIPPTSFKINNPPAKSHGCSLGVR